MDLREVAREGRAPVFGAAYEHDVASLDAPTQGLVTRFIVDGRYKLLDHTDPQRSPELYDLLKDPAEQQPLDDPQRTAALLAKLDAWWAPPK